MRTAQQWFDVYGASHRHPLNKAIHWVCVPLIAASTLGLLQALPFPVDAGAFVHWGTVAAAASLLFYFRLSIPIGVGMAACAAAVLAVNAAVEAAGVGIGLVSAAVWGGAWVAQFIGHKVEGKKPSFFEDLQFLLVGPAWMLDAAMRRGRPRSAAA